MVGIRRGQHQHGVRRRFLEGFEKAILGSFGHPLGVGQQRDAKWRDERLQAQELLQRLVVRGRPPFGMKADLVDADGFGPIITPEVGMHLESGGLSVAEQELFRQRSGYGSFAYPLLPDQAVRVREAAGSLVRPQDTDGALMTGDADESTRDRGRSPTGSSCWHA